MHTLFSLGKGNLPRFMYARYERGSRRRRGNQRTLNGEISVEERRNENLQTIVVVHEQFHGGTNLLPRLVSIEQCCIDEGRVGEQDRRRCVAVDGEVGPPSKQE